MSEKSSIKTESPQNLKKELRLFYRKRRRELSQERRKEASFALLELIEDIAPFSKVLSFKSFQEEINTALLNDNLKSQGRLYLPEIEDDEMFFSQGRNRVTDFSSTIIIVPGIAFDKDHFRLGYGKGHYDRFLTNLTFVPTIGIGFKEQFIEKLPRESHDVPLSKVRLF